MRRSPGLYIALGLLGLVALGAPGWWYLRTHSQDTPAGPGPGPAPEPPAAPATPVRFKDVAAAVGIDFRHEDGATETQYSPEVMGSGVAWLDYDRDGFLDVFFVQSGKFPPDPNATPAGPTSRLYRNRGDGGFSDVTAEVGIVTPGYGQGVTVGDYDHDGYPDLFVTHFDGGRLHHNEPGDGGKRRFRDVTKDAGLKLDGWCTSCAFGDVHGNGHLDLFVCRYLPIDFKTYPDCAEPGKTGPVRTTCGPKHFHGTRSFFFRNNGNGTFTDVSDAVQLEPGGKGLGVVIQDLDGDGRADIFVGNDEVVNHHYKNLGGGRLESVGLRSGTSTTHRGRTMGSMGIEVGDLTGGGHPDIFITTYINEGTVLYRNRGKGIFTDVSPSAGMFAASWNKVGWGTALFDPDHDGTLDLFVVNGHTHRNAADLLPREDGRPQEYAQLAQYFTGDGKGTYREESRAVGPYFETPRVGRGVAQGDFDNDGRMDLAVTHVGGPAAVLHNETSTPHHWVRLELEGSRHKNPAGSNRDAIGAVVTVRAGGRAFVRYSNGGGSYYSAHERRLLVGLGAAGTVESIEVRWPNAAGTVQRFGPVAVDRSYKLVEGDAEPQPAHWPAVRAAR
jgi:enediyne biosynthesis protein E4